MRIENLRELHNAQPFRPFTIHLSDGRHVKVQHPELLAYAPDGQTIVAFQADNTMRIISWSQVTELEIGLSRSGRKAA